MSGNESTPAELAVIGGGNMGAALVGGLLDSQVFDASQLVVVERLADRRADLIEMFPGVRVVGEFPSCKGALLAVKPGDVPAAASAAVAAGATRLLSIAAGVRLATIEAAAGDGVVVVRAMPNTPALVRLGASAIAPGSNAGDDDIDWAESILAAVGTVERMPEDALDAFTGVAGSGPAYLFLVAEALVDAAVSEGMSASTAERVVRQLLLGASTLLDQQGDPRQLRAMVTSPGGTTAAGIAVLEDQLVREAFGKAVRAATERSRELG
ncbi:MAG: pyrroline-5-carboxylate reductase [Actinobacteria bacterium]|nr:MAG: pyrroline-5-carboxylate reductase [Actinomycetota bacterium]